MKYETLFYIILGVFIFILVDHKVWQNIVQLYIPLVCCVTCKSGDVRKDLQSTLAEFSPLLFVTSQSEQLK